VKSNQLYYRSGNQPVIQLPYSYFICTLYIFNEPSPWQMTPKSRRISLNSYLRLLVSSDLSSRVESKLIPDLNRPELSHVAKWTLSSHKYGFGVENLRDDNENTFWQYVPLLPHGQEILMIGLKELNHIPLI
jgi:hypothetical protein